MMFNRGLWEYSVLLSLGIAYEAVAGPKPGNVHRFMCHRDKCVEDYIAASIIASHAFIKGLRRGLRLGVCRPKILCMDLVHLIVLNSMRITGGGNTCLGSSVLLTPIAVSIGSLARNSLEIKVHDIVLNAKDIIKRYGTVYDTLIYYKILRTIKPSYLKKTDYTHGYPNIYDRDYKAKIMRRNITLWEILEYASMKDVVAREIVEGYVRSIDAAMYLNKRLNEHSDWNRAVIETYLYLLSKNMDTIVTLKYGIELAHEIMGRASRILDLLERDYERGLGELVKFDLELQRRGINPGSIADLTAVAISLYAIGNRYNLIPHPYLVPPYSILASMSVSGATSYSSCPFS